MGTFTFVVSCAEMWWPRDPLTLLLASEVKIVLLGPCLQPMESALTLGTTIYIIHPSIPSTPLTHPSIHSFIHPFCHPRNIYWTLTVCCTLSQNKEGLVVLSSKLEKLAPHSPSVPLCISFSVWTILPMPFAYLLAPSSREVQLKSVLTWRKSLWLAEGKLAGEWTDLVQVCHMSLAKGGGYNNEPDV